MYVMATIDITPQALTVRFTTAEHVGGLIRDITVPRSAVSSVAVEPDGIRAVGGLRAPGLQLPGRRKVGTWRGFGDQPRRTAVSVTRGEPAVRITLVGQKFDQLLIGARDAASVADALGARAGG
jgi:hypothetical protein